MTTTHASLAVECDIHVGRRARGQCELRSGPRPQLILPVGRIPRVARLMALAIRFEAHVRSGTVKDYADLARLGGVTRARISQIMSLLHLAPDIQEQILFLPEVTQGRDPLVLRQVLPITHQPDWRKQRRMWAVIRSEC